MIYNKRVKQYFCENPSGASRFEGFSFPKIK
nr:MAG TPA: hypothetical protein [Caudoviricetes sp.]